MKTHNMIRDKSDKKHMNNSTEKRQPNKEEDNYIDEYSSHIQHNTPGKEGNDTTTRHQKAERSNTVDICLRRTRLQ